MAKDPSDNTITVWLVNRSPEANTVEVQIDNFTASTMNEHWKLVSPNDDPLSTENDLVLQDPVELKLKGQKASFDVDLNATSVSIITFSK